MTTKKKLETAEFKRSININDSFSKEEMKSLILIPEINILVKSSSAKKNYNPLLISKKIFYKIILEEIHKHFLKERNNLMSKIISLLIREIANISKVVEENIILNKLISHLEKRRILNYEPPKKSKVLNLSLYDISINKIENEIKDNTRTNSERHYYTPFELNKSNDESFKLSKQTSKNNTILNKKLFHGQKMTDYNFRGNNNENGGMVNEILNYNNLSTNKLASKERGNSFNKNKKILNKPNKEYIKINYCQINQNKKSNNNIKNSSKYNLSNKNRVINKRKNNVTHIYSKIEKDNIYKNSSKSINKRKINYDRDEKKTINSSFSIKKTKDSLEKKNIISPNISIVHFLNNNSDILNHIETTQFDIFTLDEKIGKENTLSLIGYYIFNRFGFYNIINYSNFEKWCKKISEGYLRTNSYHTDLHAADITHTCLIYFKIGKVNEICKFSKISKCSLFLSCMCHDYKHPGVNNNYLKETKNELSLIYNDNSILENMHISEAFKLMNVDEEYNIFNKVEINIYKQIRKEMVSCVLATDMTFHNFYVDFMKEQINNKNDKSNQEQNNNKDNKCYQNYMNLLIHSADISNPTKPFEIYFKWAKLVVNEFYEQGDKEKELGLVCSCDRNKTTLYQSQLGFINYIEIPFFSLFADIFKKLKFYLDTLNENKNKLIEMQEDENNNESNKVNNS